MGGSPYPGLPAEKLLSFLQDGQRMASPDHCPKEIYSIMLECWNRGPHFRPKFEQLVRHMENFSTQNVSICNLFVYVEAIRYLCKVQKAITLTSAYVNKTLSA